MSLAFYLSFLVFILALRHGVLQNSSDPWDAPVLVFGFGSLVVSLVAAGVCNYLYGWFFPTTVLLFTAPLLTLSAGLLTRFDKHFDVIEFGSDFVGGQVFLAGLLVYFTVVFTTAVAVAAATRLGQLMTLFVCTAVLGLGIVSDYAFGPVGDPPSPIAITETHQVPPASDTTVAADAPTAKQAPATQASAPASLLYYVVPNIGPFWVIEGLQAGSEDTTVTFGYVGYTAAYAALITAAAIAIAISLFQRREVG
jgi:hypothetical protein